MKFGNLEVHTWKSLHERVRLVHPQLADEIDKLAPNEDYSLYLGKYPYGALILDRGIFHLPNNNGQIVSIYDSSISTQFRDDLDYNRTMPVGLTVKNSFESFMIAGDRVIPATLFRKGDLLALWRVFDEGRSYQDGSFWTISSGARVVCMLPKITDKNGYQLIKSKYKLNLSIPKCLSDHWHLFTSLANQPHIMEPWESEIIFFSKKWFSHKEDREWRNLYYLLLNQVWQTSAFARNKVMFDFIFSLVQKNRNLKPNPYLADTASHLMSTGSGVTPAFTSAIDNTAGPFLEIQRIFLEDYRLKKYAPIIMHMHHFSVTENRPVYYSFQIPTTMLFSPKSNNALTTMSQLRELKKIIEILLEEIPKQYLGFERTPFIDLAEKVQFDFYHTEKDKSGEVSPIETLANLDMSFLQVLNDNKKYDFPEFSPFFRGCIAIKNK